MTTSASVPPAPAARAHPPRLERVPAGLARRCCCLLALVVGVVLGKAAETIPPAPPNHFNDFAGLVAPAVGQQLNRELAQFERETSNQILVAIYPRLQSDSSVDDYAVRVAQKWAVGQKERKNGAVLFVFKESRDVWIATGYGLEGALPDALCKRIIEEEIVPRFRSGDFAGGLRAGVQAMMAATRGEYKGTGATQRDRGGRTTRQPSGITFGSFVIFLIVLTVISRGASRRRSTVFGRRGRRTMWMGPPWGGGGWGGGSWGGGGGGWGGGGGTFSGGGGSFGGGGAGGKW